MTHLVAAAAGLILIQGLVFLVWIAAYRVQKTSIVDTFWSLLVFVAAVSYFFIFPSQPPVSIFYISLAAFWALRLSLHIHFKGRGQGEDPRYRALRQKWGADEKRRMLIFYIQQGFAAWIFSLPFFVMFANPTGLFQLWQIIGTFIWIAAFNGESIADAQLLAFKKEPVNKGRVCRTGLWKYSRHPNYFFEWLNWVAYAWLALPQPGGWIASMCPAIMYYFLTQISGIPLAEKQALQSRPVEYAEYQRTTSAFFPWFPKRKDELL